MKKQGLASIPLILVFLIMLIAVPTTIKLSQQNQNIQNRAASEIKCLLFNESNCLATPCCQPLTCQSNICQPSCQTISLLLSKCQKQQTSYYFFDKYKINCKDVEKISKEKCKNS